MKKQTLSKVFMKKLHPSLLGSTVKAGAVGEFLSAVWGSLLANIPNFGQAKETRARTFPFRPSHRSLHILVCAVVLIMTVILWQALAAQERTQIEAKTKLEAASVKIELTHHIQERINGLVRMSKRWENQGKPSQKNWESDAARYIHDWGGYQAIEWVDSSFQERWIVNLPGKEAAQNLNFPHQDRRRQTQEVLPNRRQVTVTRPFNLAQGGKGFLVYVPVFSQVTREESTGTQERAKLINLKSKIQPPTSFAGFILGVFRTQELFDCILHENIRRGYAIAIFDGDEQIYHRPFSQQKVPLGQYLERWIQETTIDIEGVTWRLQVWPEAELVALEQSHLPEVVLSAGVVMALLLGLAVRLAETARARAKLVEKINQELANQILSRRQIQEVSAERANELARSEAALGNQTRILQSILDSIGEGAIVADDRGKLILFNPAAQKIHGEGATDTPPSEWSKKYGLFLPDRVTPYPPSELPLARAIRGEAVNEAEVFVVNERSPQGIWLSSTARPIVDEEGILRGGVVVIRDITQRKQAEEELQKSEELFRSLSACLPVGIFLAEVDGFCTYANPRCHAICGFTLQESLGEGWLRAVHPQDRERVFADWSACTRDARDYSDEFRFLVPAVGAKRNSDCACERASDVPANLCCTIIASDRQPATPSQANLSPLQQGIARWVHVRSSPMLSDRGQLMGYVGTIEDITARKQAEEQLRESENRWRTIIDNEPECVKVVASDGTLLEMNAAGLAMIEAPSAEAVIGQSVYSLISPEHKEAFETLNESVCQGKSGTLEFEIIALGGTHRWMETHAVPLPMASDETVVHLAIARDITARKHAEQERIQLLALEQAARAEAEQTEQRFRFLAEIIPVQVWTARPDGGLDYVNQRVLDYFRRTSDEMLGSGWQHVLHPEDLQLCLDRWSNSLATGEPYEIEFRLLRADDKSYRWHLGRALALHDESGQIVSWFGTNTDIHDRKCDLEALRESEERFRNLVETSSEWVWEVNEKAVYTYVSPKVRDLLGYEPQEILGKTPFDLMPPEEAFRVANIFGLIAAQKQVFSFLENTNRHKDGHLVVMETSGVPVFNSEGQFKGYRGIERDITSRVRTEQALRQNEELYRLLVDGVKDYAIYMLDPSGNVVSWNAGAERIKGYRAEEIIGKHFSCYYQPHDIQQGKPEQILALAAADGRVEDEGWRIRKDGSRFWANVLVTALRDEDGKLRGFSKMTRDITERKLAAEALRESEERYRSAIETAAEGIVLQYADGSASTCNASAERILGLSAKQMFARSNLAPPFRAIHENGSPFPAEVHPARVTLRTGQPQSNVVMGVCKPNGILTWISVNTRPLFRCSQSTPYGVVFSFFDVTERKQAEEVLRLSDEVLKQMPDAILLTDLEGNIKKWMGKSEQIFGYGAEEAIGKPMSFLHQQETQGTITANIIKQIQETGAFCGEIRCRRKDGSVVPIETTAKIFYDKSGKPLFLVGVNRDITERKQTEEALRQANEKLTGWVQELEQRNSEITLLGEMSDVLQACLTVEEAHGAIAQLVQPLFPHVSGGVFAIGASNNLVEAVATWGTDLASQKLFAPHECWALRRGRAHWITDSHSGLACKHLHRHPLPAESLCLPMMAQGEALGLLYLSSSETGRLTEAKRLLALTVAEHIGLALANLKLRETLQNQSIRDPLTGLFNRRYMEESLSRELHRAQRKQQSLSLMMIDVDHFKKFNDSFGHDAGDTVLRELGRFLKNYIREADIACRYGGEEFILILPDTTLAVGHQRADQLRQAIKHLHVQHSRCSVPAIALSIGLACFPQHGMTGEALIHAADAALYLAKAQGRDRVVAAS